MDTSFIEYGVKLNYKIVYQKLIYEYFNINYKYRRSKNVYNKCLFIDKYWKAIQNIFNY